MTSPIEMIEDHLKKLDPADVAAWYIRLADLVEKKNNKVKDALAPLFLRHYIKGGGKKLVFDPPEHLKTSKYVVEVLNNHRAWYLSEKAFKKKAVGIIPRLQGGKPEWDKTLYIPHDLKLNSLVEIEVKWFTGHTPGDNDLMTALRGFQLHTAAYFAFWPDTHKNKLKVKFIVFHASIQDRYDFDEDEWFPVPNPDYSYPQKLGNPVASDKEKIAVYHRNAIRMEKAGHAAAFDIESNPWVDSRLMLEATIDPAKNLAILLNPLSGG